MIIQFGQDYFDARNGQKTPVCFDSSKLINPHVLILGASGTGKSWNIRKMIREGQKSAPNVRFHVMDVHGDLEIEGASTVSFSEAAPFGLNPFRVNPDPEFGGVRRCFQAFIRTINQASTTQLGVKQESVIRNLVLDVFRNFGFQQDDPSTWVMNALQMRALGSASDNRVYLQVPFEEKDKASAYGARWDAEKRHWYCQSENYKGELTRWAPAFKERRYPTVSDVVSYARSIHLERFLGSEQKAMRALAAVNKAAATYQKKMLEHAKINRISGNSFDPEAEEALARARETAIEAYTVYVNSVQTGLELETLVKYDSPEVLKSCIDRLGNLEATGIFKDSPAPFDTENSVWRYKLNALESVEKKMLVLFILQSLFNKAVQRGECSDVQEVIVLDELASYTASADNDGILNVIAREARKFGLALWCANQSPLNVPEGIASSVGTKVILGLDEGHWNSAINRFRIDEKQLAWIQAHSTQSVQLKEKGALKARWRWVNITP